MPHEVQAVGRVSNGGTGAGYFSGCAVARTGVGTYTITLDRPLEAARCSISFGVEADVQAKVAHTSAAVKTVTLVALAAGQAATDAAFSFSVDRIRKE